MAANSYHPKLRVRNLCKRFGANGQSVVAVKDVSFDVGVGEVFALLGPSGCGKTTTLRMIAGFEEPDSGLIQADGATLNDDCEKLKGKKLKGKECDTCVSRVKPEKRDIGVVFQDMALFPHLDVLGNVMFGLRAIKKLGKVEAKRRAMEAIDLVGLGDLEHRMPEELSGGQQQRVAVARAMAPEPRVILLDEPFSGLDAGLRESTRRDIRDVLRERGMTAVLVTHDQEEALTFADRVGVMRGGRLIQAGGPLEVYFAPRTAFVATFLGTTNLIDIPLGDVEGNVANSPLGRLRLSHPVDREKHVGGGGGESCVCVSVRPEHLELLPPRPGVTQGVVLTREFKGHDLNYAVEAGGVVYRVHAGYSSPFHVGDRVSVVPIEYGVAVERDVVVMAGGVGAGI